MCEIHLISEWIHFSNWHAMDRENNYIERVINCNLGENERDEESLEYKYMECIMGTHYIMDYYYY